MGDWGVGGERVGGCEGFRGGMQRIKMKGQDECWEERGVGARGAKKV